MIRAIILVLITALSGSGYAVELEPPTEYNGWVVDVVNGNTISILTDTKGTKELLTFQLYGIDCPEQNQEKAMQFIKNQVYEKAVNVLQLAKNLKGQILVMVYYGHNPDKLLNEEIIKVGHAQVAKHCRFPFCEDWKEIEADNRKK